MDTSRLRREYRLDRLNEQDLDPDPFKQFSKWFQQALEAQLLLPDAMTLATATREGKPSARIVLLRGFDERGFVFYTNYESQKGQELAENPYAALVFYWAELERQVRITGQVQKVTREESENYFRSRPLESRLSAWASRQSQVIPSREVLESKVEQLRAEFPNGNIPLPPDWGGFRLVPQTIEFWQGRPNRLHDRFRYTRQPDNSWLIERLAP
ncbi:MAG TPA: pyridoxamine 5'-phosphate oxidase [Candidatus Limnocylindrales bacterium]|nr:pyridoxamine 5'-phosphate oxidase [Candidatus Limnocylindrales bacterium]